MHLRYLSAISTLIFLTAILVPAVVPSQGKRTWLEERGLVDGPIAITNTHSVGVVRDAAVAWMVQKGWPAIWHAPVVAETYDGGLNDINGFHVTREHALEAMAKA